MGLRYWMLGILLPLLVATGSSDAVAQQALKVKAGKAWKHPHSRIEVPATLGGLPRSAATSFAADQLDVSVNFSVGNADEVLTLYIYRNTNGAVPIWFSQAQWAIENRPIYGKPSLHLAPRAFVPPQQTTASGLTATYSLADGQYRSTGLMLFAVGEWYVKVRSSSKSRSADEIALWAEGALTEIRWPKQTRAAPIAAPASACAAPLTFAELSKDAPKNGSADLMLAVLGIAVSDKPYRENAEASTAAAPNWCKDAQVAPGLATYRRNGDDSSYVFALGDNGNGIWVGPDSGSALLAAADEAKRPAGQRFSITRYTAAQLTSYVAQDRLPSPAQVMEIVNARRAVMSVHTWGKDRDVKVNDSAL